MQLQRLLPVIALFHELLARPEGDEYLYKLKFGEAYSVLFIGLYEQMKFWRSFWWWFFASIVIDTYTMRQSTDSTG